MILAIQQHNNNTRHVNTRLCGYIHDCSPGSNSSFCWNRQPFQKCYQARTKRENFWGASSLKNKHNLSGVCQDALCNWPQCLFRHVIPSREVVYNNNNNNDNWKYLYRVTNLAQTSGNNGTKISAVCRLQNNVIIDPTTAYTWETGKQRYGKWLVHEVCCWTWGMEKKDSMNIWGF